jgi:para-nitrobenzyl esterase
MWFRDKTTSYASSGEALGALFVEALAGISGTTSLAALRQLPQEHVLEVFQSQPEFSNYDSLAIVDGEVIPDEVATIFAHGRQADVPVMIGSNANEATTFSLGDGATGFQAYANATLGEVAEEVQAHYPVEDAEESWIDLFSDVYFAYPMRVWAREMENVKSDAYLYWFTWAPPVENSEKYRAFHAAEIGYVFGNLDLFGAQPTQDDRDFSDFMATVWTQFAKTGSPNGLGLPEWPAYSSDTEAYIELGKNTGKNAELRVGRMDLIRRAWDERRRLSVVAGASE